ncbi:CBS domain-containing protein, partial [Candidatus Saccharibacteria bacterium]|nr:CBS domain-containing protein [Candidatus Saccharibacteria bacterium]
PRSDITFVSQDEVLGPLVLDKLYKSGYAHFPVVDARRHVIGLLHTEALNSLEIRETDVAKNFLDPNVYYVRADYSLEQVLAAFLRTNCYFFLVIDKTARLVGMLTYEMLTDYLLGGEIVDDFDRDNDRQAVAQR